MSNVPFRWIIVGVLTVLFFVVSGLFLVGATEKNNIQTFQIYQSVSGSVAVIDEPGWWWSNFGTVWTYDKTIQKYWSLDEKANKDESQVDESIRVTFNDAGNARVSTFVQVSLPVDKEKRLLLHEKFGGNKQNILHAIHAHLQNCMKNTGPLMSVTENQASRKAEFTQVVEDQLRNGLYQMKRTRIQLKDRVDDKGNTVWVEANEVVLDEKGTPRRTERSPLQEYGIVVNQFSITGTEYDQLSQEQFKAKQEAYLSAEKSKAQREQEVQQRLYIMAQGERQAAEQTSKGNVLKAEQTVAGETRVAVAEQAKREAETLAAQQLAVAEMNKKTAETKATMDAEVAKIAAEQAKNVLVTQANAAKEAAELQAEAAKVVLVTQANAAKDAASLQAEADRLKATGVIALAEAKAKEIQLGGAVAERDRVLATIKADRDVKVAENLSKIQVPRVIFNGSNGGNSNSIAGMDGNLLNVKLLKDIGLFDFNTLNPSRVDETILPVNVSTPPQPQSK